MRCKLKLLVFLAAPIFLSFSLYLAIFLFTDNSFGIYHPDFYFNSNSNSVILKFFYQMKRKLMDKIPSSQANGHIEYVNHPNHLEKDSELHHNLNSHCSSYESYLKLYNYSLEKNEEFWKELALKYLSWIKPFSVTKFGDFDKGNIIWFPDGQINACYNALDRHAYATPEKVALIYEADEPNTGRKITYRELLEDVCRLANWMSSLSYLKTGDVVTIYMPLIPEAVVSMLACARLGLVHNVVFAGFSSEALAGRLLDSKSKLIITADQGLRGGKVIPLKACVSKALEDISFVKNVLVFRRTGGVVSWNDSVDVLWQDVLPLQRPYAPINTQTLSESPLFLLYTSGSTGKPKGVLHTTGGYLLYVLLTSRFVFDLKPNDIFGCMADVGWITGHSYVVYGPLANGITTLLFEGIPIHPTPSRYWEIVQEHKLTQLYTAPTVIRTLISKGVSFLENYDLSTLRVLGSVGEPIHPETWKWYYDHVGKGRCSVVDTFWQTETGGIVISPLANCTPTKPGSASFPFFGIEPVILDAEKGTEMVSNSVSGVLAFKRPWPGMARSIFGNHAKYLNVYFETYKGYFFTGDGAYRDGDGYYYLTGRVDDVINVSGHRLSTGEIESALGRHPFVAESAVLGEADEITGQSICAFVSLKSDIPEEHNMTVIRQELINLVRTTISPIATPKRIVICTDLPKTRSGKIMRRILRKIVAEKDLSVEKLLEGLGDMTTLSNPNVIQSLLEAIKIS